MPGHERLAIWAVAALIPTAARHRSGRRLTAVWTVSGPAAAGHTGRTTGLTLRSRCGNLTKADQRRSPGGGGTHASSVPSSRLARTFSRSGILCAAATRAHDAQQKGASP